MNKHARDLLFYWRHYRGVVVVLCFDLFDFK